MEKYGAPWSSQLLLGAVVAFAVRNTLWTSPLLLHDVKHPLYDSDTQTAAASAACRLLFSFIIFADCLFAILYGDWLQNTEYESGSALKPITLHFQGYCKQTPANRSILKALLTMSSFTMVSWMILGVAFGLSGWIGMGWPAGSGSTQLLRCYSVIAWQCAAPTTLLVSSVVKYVLWPSMSDTTIFRHPLTLLEHNGNTIMVAVDVLLLGGRETMASLPNATTPTVLLGVAYVLFSWGWKNRWAAANHGPQFLYPFFDTSLPAWRNTLYLVTLLLVLQGFAWMLVWAQKVLYQVESTGIRLVALLLTVLLTCRWRD